MTKSLVTFAEETRNGKLHFLHTIVSVKCGHAEYDVFNQICCCLGEYDDMSCKLYTRKSGIGCCGNNKMNAASNEYCCGNRMQNVCRRLQVSQNSC